MLVQMTPLAEKSLKALSLIEMNKTSPERIIEQALDYYLDDFKSATEAHTDFLESGDAPIPLEVS